MYTILGMILIGPTLVGEAPVMDYKPTRLMEQSVVEHNRMLQQNEQDRLDGIIERARATAQELDEQRAREAEQREEAERQAQQEREAEARAIEAREAETTTPVEPEPVPDPEPEPTPETNDSIRWDVWLPIARCESGYGGEPDWSINTGNGFYGGLQFTLNSWQWVGGEGYPHHASAEEQIYRAEKLLELQGWQAWPACSKKVGYR